MNSKLKRIKVFSKKKDISSFKELADFGKATPDGVVLPEGFSIKRRLKQIKYVSTKCSNFLREDIGRGEYITRCNVWKPSTVFKEYIDGQSEFIIKKCNKTEVIFMEGEICSD